MTPAVDYPFTAESYAIIVHSGQKYGDKEYSYHLQKVVAIISKYTTEQHIIDAAWLHDVIEDTSITYFELARKFGATTANMVWACTGVGANRRERQASIKAKLTIFPGAPMVKLADRMGNMEAGIEEENVDKFSMYAREHYDFGPVVASYVPEEMYKDYVNLIKQGCRELDVPFQESIVDRHYFR